MLGVTSVTFRKLSCGRIIELAAQSGLDGIEWGADVHVLPGNLQQADRVRRMTEDAGLTVLSYGSYYRLCESGGPARDFVSVLESAATLRAPVIRIWAGSKGPRDADGEYYRHAADEARSLCRMAEQYHIEIALEYHRGTLTENCESTRRFLTEAECSNLKTYWQPNPDIPHPENCRELSTMIPCVSNIHVFQWLRGNRRLRLNEGKKDWLDYLKIVQRTGGRPNFILEYVLRDSPDIFAEDAATLRELFDLNRIKVGMP